MPTYKQFGLTNLVGSVANIGSGVGYWTMTHPVGAPDPATIEIDFGYPVELKSIAWVKSQGDLGRWDIVGSNTPATSTADVYVPANGDIRNSGWIDDLGLVLYHAGFTGAFRYYRLLLVGDASLPSSGAPSLGPDDAVDPYYRDHKLTDIICNVAMVATAFGYTTQSGTLANLVDRNGATSWTPYATTWPSSTPSVSPPSLISATPSSADTYPALQIDMGEAVAVTKFKLTAFHAASLGAAMLYASNNPAHSLSDTIQLGDVRIGTYSETELCSGVDLDTDLKTSGEPFRYYRFIATRGVGPGPDGTAVSSFTPGFFPASVASPESWNPLEKAAGITLSNSNRTATLTSGSNQQEFAGTLVKSSGKWYFEYTNPGSLGSDGYQGIVIAARLCTTSGRNWFDTMIAGIASNLGGLYVIDGGIHASGVGSYLGQTTCFAVDLDNKTYWMRLNSSLNWNNSPTANPATNTGGYSIASMSSSFKLYAHLGTVGDAITMNPGSSAFVGAVPAGFQAWQEPDSYHAFFVDDGGLEDIVMSLSSPGPAYLVRLSDGDSDALVANVTITHNPVLTADFTDDAELDAFSDIFPSTIVQTMVHTTGR